jgi:hypothetical protein
MKLTAPYRCDYCDKFKGEANHWWLRPTTPITFVLEKWDNNFAALDSYEHICSEACAVKALAKWMAAQ